MEGNNGCSATRSKTANGCMQALFKSAQLVINGYSKRLKAAFSGMSARSPGCGRYPFFNQLYELPSRLYRVLLATIRNNFGDPSGKLFFSVLEQNTGNFPFRPFIYDFACREVSGLIHPHIQGSIGIVAEAAIPFIKLGRGYTKIK
ncbi:hypothetical protein D3C78_997450 [compost metagenome]